ncbi:hypothetical protein [Uliginosibacterium sediminicola]|uniref:Uncharacterized protein n=1 Tax=Uliginosibacterium sediminicola TaxID=2024550 RepID=A0ABU9Z156_9RHOO
MKNIEKAKILVVARDKANLVKLSSRDSPMIVQCGTIGRTIAQKVLDGGGKAVVLASEIKMAIDTTDGANAIQDNFDLFENRTKEPLLHYLLKNQ